MRLATFAKNRGKGYWYLTRSYFTVPVECAAEIGKAIISGSKGQPFGDPPAWWADSQAQYREWKRKVAETDKTPAVTQSDTPS